jgi:hypothetical protein
MSHFTHVKTRFQNISYLTKALNRLNIVHYKQKKTAIDSKNCNNNKTNLLIPQINSYDIEFSWNGEEYELILDMSFWKQSSTVESFIDKIAQEYAGEVIIGESEKMGFEPIKTKQNNDGSNTLILERWNEKKIVETI